MGKFLVLAMLFFVTGCGIPPAVTIATYALDGVVFAASGKTARDHALSTVAEQDCSLFHVVSGEPICMDYQPTEAAAAALAEMPANEASLMTTSDGRVIRVAIQSTTQVASAELAMPSGLSNEPLVSGDAEPIRLIWEAPQMIIQ